MFFVVVVDVLVSEHLKHDRQHNVCGHLFSGERFPEELK